MSEANIVIGTLLWRRHEVFRVWAEALLDAVTGPHAVVVAGSEGDRSRRLVESYGFFYVEVPNEPLGAKANARFKACRQLDPDYVILCGSDDIVCPATFARYREIANEGKVDEVAISDIYHLNAHTGELGYNPGFSGERADEPIAPWRMLGRKLCDAVDWQLWDESAPVHLDGHSHKRLGTVLHSEQRLYVRDEGLFVCDIKSNVSITAWEALERLGPAAREQMEARLSPDVVTKLDALKVLLAHQPTEHGGDHLRAYGQHNRAQPVRIGRATHGTWHVVAEPIAGSGSAGKGSTLEEAVTITIERALARLRGEPDKARSIILALGDVFDAYKEESIPALQPGGYCDGSGI